MTENLQKFNSLGNPFFSILERANDLHRTARQSHLELFKLCQEKGVKFEDLQNHLIKEAKKCGLYRKNHWNKSTGKMDYPALSRCKNLSWHNSMFRFLKWVKENYISYHVEAGRKIGRKYVAPQPKVVIIREQSGKKAELPTENPSNTIAPNSAAKTSKAPEGDKAIKEPREIFNTKDNPLTLPVVSELTDLQKQVIVLSNLDILGKKALELGAGFEFNELIAAMGLDSSLLIPDELIDIEFAKQVQKESVSAVQ